MQKRSEKSHLYFHFSPNSYFSYHLFWNTSLLWKNERGLKTITFFQVQTVFFSFDLFWNRYTHWKVSRYKTVTFFQSKQYLPIFLIRPLLKISSFSFPAIGSSKTTNVGRWMKRCGQLPTLTRELIKWRTCLARSDPLPWTDDVTVHVFALPTSGSCEDIVMC